LPWLFRALACLPLPILHALGALLGLGALARGRYRAEVVGNLRQAGLYSPAMLARVAMELGKNLMELPYVWLRPYETVLSRVRYVRGWEHLETARARGRGVLLLGPHLGCIEVAGLHVSSRLMMTVLYRRPRQDWAHAMMSRGRNQGHIRMVEPGLPGVRALLASLKRNELVWVLPDQRASKGEGAWVPLFGRWTYMPTLIYRLRASSGATPLLMHCRRLSWGRGYGLEIAPLPELPDDIPAAMRVVNHAMETLIRGLPEQYLWSYRFQRRKPAPPEGPAL